MFDTWQSGLISRSGSAPRSPIIPSGRTRESIYAKLNGRFRRNLAVGGGCDEGPESTPS
jgi:hypothetical protein